MRIEFFCQQNDNKNINFDEGVSILDGRFSEANVIFKVCHFCLKSHNWSTSNFHYLAPSDKVSALALKNEASMNKNKHSLRNFAVLQSGGATQRNSSVPHHDFW